MGRAKAWAVARTHATTHAHTHLLLAYGHTPHHIHHLVALRVGLRQRRKRLPASGVVDDQIALVCASTGLTFVLLWFRPTSGPACEGQG